MTNFSKFLKHYAGEAMATADAIATVIAGIALPPVEAAKVNAIVDMLREAGNSIIDSLPEVEKVEKIVIKKSDIEDAVAKVLPAMLAKALAAKDKETGK